MIDVRVRERGVVERNANGGAYGSGAATLSIVANQELVLLQGTFRSPYPHSRISTNRLPTAMTCVEGEQRKKSTTASVKVNEVHRCT